MKRVIMVRLRAAPFAGVRALGIALTVGALLALGGMHGDPRSMFGIVFVVALAIRHLYAGGSGTARFGLDGIALASRVRRQFVAYRDVRLVRRTRSGVRVVLESGTCSLAPFPQALPPRGSKRLHHRRSSAAEVRRWIADFIEDRVTTVREESEETSALFERRDDSVATWRTRLGEVARAPYRSRATPSDTILEVLEAAGCSAQARLGAAVVLIDVDPQDGPERVRRVAALCMEPRLCQALEAIVGAGHHATRVDRALSTLGS